MRALSGFAQIVNIHGRALDEFHGGRGLDSVGVTYQGADTVAAAGGLGQYVGSGAAAATENEQVGHGVQLR
ncbi:Uncharacterised protein [Mycobacteroides abscessus subsp. abscessus]|nr:Uncharacterised protein [Mycobacteroides abscessus subsp. abscessus]